MFGTSWRFSALLATVFFQIAFSQPDLETQARRLTGEGEGLLQSREYSAALETLRRALALWEKLQNTDGQATANARIGIALQALSQGKDALKYRLRAGEQFFALGEFQLAEREFMAANEIEHEILDFESEGNTRNALGEVMLAKGDLGWAEEYLKTALAAHSRMGQSDGAARALANLGDLYTRSGRYEDALAALGRAAAMRDKSSDTERLVLFHTGVLYSRLARYEEAITRLREALAMSNEPVHGEFRGRVLAAIGAAELHVGVYKEAQARLEEALKAFAEFEHPLNRSVVRGLKPLSAAALNNLGEVYLAQKNLDYAEQHFVYALRSLAIFEDDRPELRGGADRTLLALQSAIRYNIGFTAFLKGEYDKASDEYGMALAIQQDMADQAGEGRTLCEIARVYQAQRKAGEALTKFAEAERLQEMIGDRQDELTTRAYHASLLRDQGHYQESVSQLAGAVEILESLRGGLDTAEYRMGFFGIRAYVPQLMTDLLADLAGRTDAPDYRLAAVGESWAEAALHYSERARARTAIELLARDRGAGLQLPQALREEEARIVRQQESALRMFRAPSVDVRGAREAMQQSTDELQNFVVRLRGHGDAEVRAYAALRYPEPVKADAIRSALKPDEVLIEYAVLPERTVVWAISRMNGTRLFASALGASKLAELVRQVRAALENELPLPDQAVAKLQQELLAPLAAEIPKLSKLMIVPDGALFQLPFEVLTQQVRGIAYWPSATMMVLSRARMPHPPARPLLAFADPEFSPESDFHTLKGSREEVVRIGGLFSLTEGSSELKLGKNANESVLKQLSASGELAQYRHVHFATHGVVGSDAPQIGEAALVLASTTDGREDGYLKASEISSLRLNADVVVLSACQTALGENVPGEGIVGLTRAFLSAGARSTVVSLWRVADQSTADLMYQFYLNMRAPEADRAEALAQARLQISQQWPHPFYWAPFIFVGER
jgi:CHAT domain-containing protein/uncharacterized protein HemY